MNSELDLKQLALDRGDRSRPNRARRRVVSRYLIPAAIGVGFSAMLGWAARDHFLPRKPVTVVPVVMTRAEIRQAGTPLFQAAGWIEPRPTPVLVTALAEGVVEELLVVDGQSVQAGEPVARLIEVDARLALEQAEADLALREAEIAGERAELRAAKLRWQHPSHREAPLAEAESLLAKMERELGQLPLLLQAAQARLRYARQDLEGKRAAGAAVSGRTLQQAQTAHDVATAELQELEQRKPRLQGEAEALRRKRDALAQQRELLIEESRSVADSEARLQAAEARLRQARLAVQKARLELERMVVRTPVAGRVLELIARPGTRVAGRGAGSTETSARADGTVVSLYDPKMLQVRADVRLEDVPLVQPGQAVQIETASSKEPIQGEVLYATSTANVQKNTLEVKVALRSPPEAVRPEMLVTATFLAPARPENESEEHRDQERLLAPRQLVESTGDGHAVWTAAADGVARRRSVRLGKAGTEALVEVVEGLTPTDKLISGGREGLADGDRITITGEDSSMGMRTARRQPEPPFAPTTTGDFHGAG